MSKRILVVEDQPDNRQIIRDMLAPTDYEIIEAEDGEQALALLWQIYSSCIFVQIHFRQCGHRRGDSRAIILMMA
jgi:CheY-like chemotaxis protein